MLLCNLVLREFGKKENSSLMKQLVKLNLVIKSLKTKVRHYCSKKGEKALVKKYFTDELTPCQISKLTNRFSNTKGIIVWKMYLLELY